MTNTLYGVLLSCTANPNHRHGTSRKQVLMAVQRRPPNSGITNEYGTRKIAFRNRRQRRQEEQLVGSESEAHLVQVDRDGAEQHPDAEGQQQTGNGNPQVAGGNTMATLLPKALSSGRQS